MAQFTFEDLVEAPPKREFSFEDLAEPKEVKPEPEFVDLAANNQNIFIRPPPMLPPAIGEQSTIYGGPPKALAPAQVLAEDVALGAADVSQGQEHPLHDIGFTPENVPQGEQMKGVMRMLTPGIPEQLNVPFTSAVRTGVGFADFLTSRSGMGQTMAAMVPGLDVAMGAKFFKDMVHGGYANLEEMGKAWQRKDWQTFSDNLFGAVSSFAMAGGLGKHTPVKALEHVQALKDRINPPLQGPPASGESLRMPPGAEVPDPRLLELIQEGVRRQDAADLLAGKVTSKQVVERNLKVVGPAWDAGLGGGHAEAWIQGYHNAIYRIDRILGTEEAAAPPGEKSILPPAGPEPGAIPPHVAALLPNSAEAAQAAGVTVGGPTAPEIVPETIRVFSGSSGTGSSFFTTNQKRAESFGSTVQYIDLTPAEAAEAKQKSLEAGMPASDMILSNDQVKRAKPIQSREQEVHNLDEPVEELLTLPHGQYTLRQARDLLAQATVFDPAKVATVEVPLSQIKLSKDVPNFKFEADPDTGVVSGEKLTGKFERLGTGPIVVWRRRNGDIEVITGRHRLDLARRSGESTIPAQIVDEAKGFTKEMALTFDAEANIRDQQGTVEDYAHYFKGSPQLSEAVARERGLLARAKGKAGFDLGRHASDDLYSLWKSAKITEAQALAIVRAAPSDAAKQQLGVRLINQGKSAEYVRAALERERGKTETATQTDMFGNPVFDDSKADAETERVVNIRRDLKANIAAAQGAARNPAAAAKMGIDIKDPQGVAKKIAELRALLERWEGPWWLDKDLAAQVSGRTVAETKPPAPAPTPAPVKPTAPASGELFGSATPFNLTGGTVEMVKPAAEVTGFGKEQLVQNELFAIQKVVESKDPTKSADAAQKMYGSAKVAADKIEAQLRVVDADPKQKKAFVKEQRDRLKEVIALLRQREQIPNVGKPAPVSTPVPAAPASPAGDWVKRMEAAKTQDEGRELVHAHAEAINALEQILNFTPTVGQISKTYYRGFSTIKPAEWKRRIAHVKKVAGKEKADQLADLVKQGQEMEVAWKALLKKTTEPLAKHAPVNPETGLRPGETKLLADLTKRVERGDKLSAAEQKRYTELRNKATGKKVEEKPEVETGLEEEQQRQAPTDDLWKRVQEGDESAWEELDAQFREIYPDPIDLGLGQSRFGGDPRTVHTPEAFVALFTKAFAARDFETILDAIKATSDLKIWKPYLQKLFRDQKTDPIAAAKAEWVRHVFAGTVPPDAIPRPKPPPRQPPPPPRPGAGGTGPRPGTGGSGPPPGGQPPPPRPPPAPPPTRIQVDPIRGGTGKSPYQIIEDFSRAIGKQVHKLRMRSGVLGFYRPGSTTTATRFAGDLDTTAHELAGHWVDDKYGIGKPWIKPKTRSPYDAELAKFWPFGSVTPRSTLAYRRAEGIAEFIRAYVVNPKQAKLDAPKFAKYFESTLPPEALKAINDFGTDVRTWAGTDPLKRAALNIRIDPPTFTEKLWHTITGRGLGFEVDPIDRLRMMFDDAYHYAVKANNEIREMRGGKAPLPQEDFELTTRLLSGHDSRVSDQFEHGLTTLRPAQKVNADGELEVERLIDPVTKQPMTLKWLLGTFDTSKGVKEFTEDRAATSAYMVAQRTVEKSKQLGRPDNLSNEGAGIYTDLDAAKALLAQVAQDPALEAHLKEGARRYRLWADKNIQMLVDADRITQAQADQIRQDNQQYVDMHRLAMGFEAAKTAQGRRGALGRVFKPIQRFKGSTLQLNDVYANLLEQTDAIQQEASRNVVMNNFTDGLRNVRSLHGADMKELDDYGRKVTSADENTITIFKNGKAEHWQFAEPVYEALKGLGEIPSNMAWNLATSPSRFVRHMITLGPSFIVRNVIRDTFERAVNSKNAGKPWDVLEGYSQAELSRYEAFGGGQFGNYIRDRQTWNRELKKAARELVKDPHTILLSPLRFKQAWEALAEKSEKIGRLAEFRRAFEAGKEQIAKDHPNLTPEQVEYNAALYAASQARGLLDFAKAGTVMRHVNQAIPFTNAAMRGLGKSIHGMKTNPGRYAMNWALYVLTPTVAAMMWNKRDPETWEEYKQLPQYRRDFFWNLKVGDYWLTVPRPHLLGVLAGGAERMIEAAIGEKHPMEGYGKSLSNTLPVSNLAEATGPLKTGIELMFNRDSFRGRDIVPDWEKGLKLDLRKGKEHASGAGKGFSNALRLAGLEVDPRNIDHILNSMGGWGTLTTSFTSKNYPLEDAALKSTGLFTETPGAAAENVQWVFDWARRNGKMANSDVKKLQGLRKSIFEADTHDGRVVASARTRKYATELRENIEAAGK